MSTTRITTKETHSGKLYALLFYFLYYVGLYIFYPQYPLYSNYRISVNYLFTILGIYRPLRNKRVYLSLSKVADTPFHIQG